MQLNYNVKRMPLGQKRHTVRAGQGKCAHVVRIHSLPMRRGDAAWSYASLQTMYRS